MRAEDSALASIELADGVRVLESDLGASRISASATIIVSDGMITIEENHVRLLASDTDGWRLVSGAQLGIDDGTEPDELARPRFDVVRHFRHRQHRDVRQRVRRPGRRVRRLAGRTNRPAPGRCRTGFPHPRDPHGNLRLSPLPGGDAAAMQTRVSPLDLMVESGDPPVRGPGRYDVRSSLARGEAMSWT